MPNSHQIKSFSIWGMLLLATGLLMTNALAQNVSVTDYQVPESSANRLLIDLSGTHSTQGSDTITSKGNAGAVYKRFFDSLPYGYTIDVIGSGSANKDIVKDEYVTDYSIDASARFKKYLNNDSNFFGSLRATSNMLKSYDRPAETATLAVGYGRFIEATALAKAVRVEDFLMKEGILRDHLPKAAILEVSEVIARESEFEEQYGSEYRREWYEAIEDVLARAGALTEQGLGAVGILRVDEVIERERIADRFYGWDVSVGTKFDIVMPFEDQDRPPLSLDLSANYARPISWRLQLNERLSMNTPVDDFAKAYTLSLASDISYELSNRIDFRLRHLLNMNKIGEGIDVEYGNSLGISFIYYLENYVNLVATEQIEKTPGQKTTTNTLVTLNYRVF